MSEHSVDELKNWAESLRDRVSRVSGRKKSAAASGFNSELKGDLLDAIDLLLEQVEDPIEEPAPAWLSQVPGLLADHLHEWQEKVAQSVSGEVAGPLEQWQTGFAESLRTELKETLTTELGSELGSELNASLSSELNAALSASLAEHLATHLADQLTASVEQSLGASADSTSDVVRSSVKESFGDLEEKLDESLTSNLVNALSEGLSQTVSRALNEALNEHLEQSLASAIQPSLAKLPSGGNTEDLAEVSESLKQDIEQVQRETAEKTSLAIDQLAAQQQELKDKISSYEELLGDLAEQTNAALASSTNKGLRKLTEDTKAQSLKQTESFEALTKELREHGLVDPSYVKGLEEERDEAAHKRDEAQSECEKLTASNEELTEKMQQLADQFSNVNDECAQLMDQVEELQRGKETLESEIENCRTALEQAQNDSQRLEELEIQNGSLKEDLEFAQESVRDMETQLEGASAAEGNVSESEIEELLSIARKEIEDLRNQNSDLAAQLAKQQVLQSNSAAQAQCDEENLSWEDRKRLIMQQFMDEEDASQGRTEVEQVIASTERELEKREQKIEELMTLLEDNQEATNQESRLEEMVNQDEVIQQEREKLKAIQEEWEEKLRQAEIDLSMERAKLARERLELESAQAERETETKPGKGRTRKWLDHLGLREEQQPPSE